MSESAAETAIQPAVSPELSALAELTPSERLSVLIEHRKLIQQVMEKAMVEGVHYGIIRDQNGNPINKRPTLYDPGALFLMFIWGLRGLPVFEVAEESFDPPRFVYVVRYELYHIKTGMLVGCGYGSANSFEPQWYYRWVKANELPPGVDPQQLPKKTVRPKDGGHFELYRVVNSDLTALQNTIRKQAVVRARRDAVLTVTASKDLFTQDLDEIPLPSAEGAEAIPIASETLPEGAHAEPPRGRQQPSRTDARRRRSSASTTAPAPPAATPPANQQMPSGPSSGTSAAEGTERPVLPAEWAQLINDAAKRGWTQPAIAAAYKQIAGKSMDQRPTRQEFERLREVLAKPAPGMPAQTEVPF